MKSYGTLEYDPRNLETRYQDWWALLKCDPGIVNYYRHLIEKCAVYQIPSTEWARLNKFEGLPKDRWVVNQAGFKLNKSAWGPHISVIRGEKPRNLTVPGRYGNVNLWKKYQGKRIEFEYNPEYLNTNGKHWWVRVFSKELEDIRMELGLTPQPLVFSNRKSKWVDSPFHLTIGVIAI